MSNVTDGEASGCTLQWKIVNLSHCWFETQDSIESPVFIPDALIGTGWYLEFYPMGDGDESITTISLCREIDLGGPDVIEVNYQFAFLGKDGSILKETTVLKDRFSKNHFWGSLDFDRSERERYFVTEREAFLPDDTLTIQCSIWNTDHKPDKSKLLCLSTVIKLKRRSFVWRIDKPSSLESGVRTKFVDYLMGFDLQLHENLEQLCVKSYFLDSVKYISCSISIIDSEERMVNCGILKYFCSELKEGGLRHFTFSLSSKKLKENKGRYFANDVLSFHFEFVLSTVEILDCRKYSVELETELDEYKNEFDEFKKSQNSSNLIADLLSLYNTGIHSDIELRTNTKAFPAHKAILGARSPVFLSMFSQDMTETNSGYVDITDFEENTVHRMLLYVYTETLESMQFENSYKLYEIADKYHILPLKRICSSFLKDDLCPANACDVLVLADLHEDHDLKKAVLDFIPRQRKKIFCSNEWKDLMKTHPQLATRIMYKKLTNIDLELQ